MKVLFAVSNEEISEAIIKRYQKEYKEIISHKNVYYFNAILKEIQKDKSYDRIVISEELEAFTNTQYDQIDKFIFEKLDSISDEAANVRGSDTPIILICSDRREKGEEMLVKLFGIGIYDALIGNDRSVEEVCKLINKPRSKKEAKIYYKVESDEVKYQSENENDVSEQEIQNILAHYKKLGKNEEQYVTSFNNIVAQYNDAQLRIISKFLPLNVRAVLEEKSPKYQQIMSFNNTVTNSIRKPNKEQDLGPSGKLLRPKNTNNVLTGPVVIPSSVNTNNVRKLSRNHPNEQNVNSMYNTPINSLQNNRTVDSMPSLDNDIEDMDYSEIQEPIPKRRGRPKKIVSEDTISNLQREQPKRRGRPKKNAIEEELLVPDDNILPGFESPKNVASHFNNQPEDVMLPGFDNQSEDEMLPGFDSKSESGMLPGFDSKSEDEMLPDFEEEDTMLPGFGTASQENSKDDNAILPGFENINTSQQQMKYRDNAILPGFETVKNTYSKPSKNYSANNNINNYSQPQVPSKNIDITQNNSMNNIYNQPNEPKSYDSMNNIYNQPNESKSYDSINDIYNQPNESKSYDSMNNIYNQPNAYDNDNNSYMQNPVNSMQESDFSTLLTGDKKVVTFVGTSKNGTSFILNNLAEYASSMGINVAILDTTQNKNSYYIYTKNEEELRQVAATCLDNLVHGQAKGISVNRNLTVYTSLPEDRENLNNVSSILETLIRMHSLVLIDCDFYTPTQYFAYAQEIYLVQSLDILTIQPLTAFLRELKAQNVLDENKIKIILNKYVKVRGISEKTIIGGMSKYNDPAMSFMTDLFDVNAVKYITIPFEQEIYTRYLESVINCDVSIKGYSKSFMQVLKELTNWIYPMSSGSNTYRPPAVSYNNAFSPSMNNTLNQMKRKY